MKVLAFIEATVVNGAAKSLLNLCEAAEQHDGGRALQFELATFERSQSPAASKQTEFAQAVGEAGLQLHVIGERGRFDLSCLRKIRALLRKVNPDVVQTNNVKSHFLLRMAGALKNTPSVAVHHGYTTTDWKMQAYNQLDRFSLPRFDRVVTVCEPFRQALIARGVAADRISVVHNSIGPPNTFSEDQTALRQAFGLTSQDRVVLSVGRFSQEKGHADLVIAFSLFRNNQADVPWKLVLVGSGPEKERLQALAQRFGVNNDVIFAGQQQDVMPFYSLASLFVLPSHSEGSPHVLLEAMQARVPIVSTAVGGIPEILTGPNRPFLPPPADPAALAQAMAQLSQNDTERTGMVEHNASEVSSRFSHHAYLRCMFGIYEAAMLARRGVRPMALAACRKVHDRDK